MNTSRNLQVIHADDVRFVVAQAVKAPSGGNCQPWRFRWDQNRLLVFQDRTRKVLQDFEYAATNLAIGAAIENLELAARERNWMTEVAIFPNELDETLAAQIVFMRSANVEKCPLFPFLNLRCTNRRLGSRQSLPDHELQALEAAVAPPAQLFVFDDQRILQDIAIVMSAGDRYRFFDRRFHQEMFREVRWNDSEATVTGDGLDVATLEMPRADRVMFRMLSYWPVMRLFRHLGAGKKLDQVCKNWIDSCSAIVLVAIPDANPSTLVQAGRTVERLWLTATAHNIALHPMVPPFMYLPPEMSSTLGITPDDFATLSTLREQFSGVLRVPTGMHYAFFFRLSLADPPSARSLRRNVDEVLEFAPAQPAEHAASPEKG